MSEVKVEKYKVENPFILSSWKEIAVKEITRWLEDDEYKDKICRTTMTEELLGPFTKFLYHFAWLCESGWGVMVDFNERTQRIYLTNFYYKWMHTLRDEIIMGLEQKGGEE
jgi:hypothetical protein